MRLEPGQRVGVYEIVGSLGAGGMGEVYQARDTRLGRPVAIKFVSDELAVDRTASERLEREARLTSLLNHPNIVTVHDVGEMADGRPYVVMEFVEGQSLHAAMQWERLKLSRVMEIASQVADGLAVAHDAGIVHRDLKPRNIMLTADGRAKIVDFGLGKTIRPAPGSDDPTFHAGALTDTMVVVGTAGYMAPEQVTTRPIDFRADQFALGAIIYEMLTGRRAFKRDTAVQTMAAIVESEPEPLSKLAPETPIELATVVERCLAKDPAHRYASTQDLARDLRDIRGLMGSRSSRSGLTLRRPPRPRQRWLMAAVAAVVLALLAIGVYVVRDPTPAEFSQARAWLDRYDKQANVDRAIEILTAVVNVRPRDPTARSLLAEAYVRKFEYAKDTSLADRAGEEAGTALSLDQAHAPAHVVLSMLNYSQGRNEGAFGEAEKAIAVDSRNGRAWRERGRAQVRLGRRDEAERDFLAAVKLDPNDWIARANLGALYLAVNKLDDAMKEFARIIELVPDNTRAYNNLGSAYFQQERFDKATEMYERSLSLDKNATAFSNLGTALYQQGRYADAARSYEGAVALPGATFLHWFNLAAACYWAPDLRTRAKEAYEMAAKLGEPARAAAAPDASRLAQLASSYAILALLTQADEARAHRSRAEKLLALAEQQQPLDASDMSTIASVHEELGDRAKALTWLEQAIAGGYPINRIERSPWLKELRSDERYIRLRK